MSTIALEGVPGVGCREVHLCSLCSEPITWEDARLVRVRLAGAPEQAFHAPCLEVYALSLDEFVGAIVRPRLAPRLN